MKRQVSKLGVRKWFSDDYTGMQNEIYAALEGSFSPYGSMILKGCEVTNNGDGTHTIADGLILLPDNIGANYRICRFYQKTISSANFPVYLVQDVKTSSEVAEYGRLYKDGNTKDIVNEYFAKVETTQPGHSFYLQFSSAGGNKRFRDALQSSSYRFVTDTEKSTWNSKAPGVHGHAATDISQSSSYRFVTDTEKSTWNNARAGAVSDIRDGVATDKNTLKKFWDVISGNLSSAYNHSQVKSGNPHNLSLADIGESYADINYWAKSGDDLSYSGGNVNIEHDGGGFLRISGTGGAHTFLGDGGSGDDGQLILYQSAGGPVGALINGGGDNNYVNIAGGNFGIKTTTPDHTLDVNGDIGLTSNLYANINLFRIRHGANNTSTNYFNIDAPNISTATQHIRIGRNTNSTGDVIFDIYRGDGTASSDTKFSANGDSYINALGGQLAINKITADYTLDVNGTGRFTSNLISEGNITASGVVTTDDVIIR